MSFTYLDQQAPPAGTSGKFTYLDDNADSKLSPDSISKNMDQGQNFIQATGKQIQEHPFKTLLLDSPRQSYTGESLEQLKDRTTPDYSNRFANVDNQPPGIKNLNESSITSDEFTRRMGLDAVEAVQQPVNYLGGKLVQGAGKVLDALPQGLRDASGRLYNWMVKNPLSAYRYGKDPAAIMAKEKVTGNSMTDLANNFQDRLDTRNSQLQEAVKGSDKTVNVQDSMDNHFATAQKEADESLQDRSSISDKLDLMKQKMQDKYGDLNNLSVQDAVKLKRQLADDFPFSGDPEGNIMAKTAHKMYHDINSAVEQAHPEIADLNDSVSSLIDISKAARNRVALESRNNPIGLISTILGAGTGSLIGHGVEGGAAGLGVALASKAATSPAVLSRVAKTLSNLADIDKINLYKAVPAFKSLADKAKAWADEHMPELNKPKLGLSGKVGSGVNPSEAPIVGNMGEMDASAAGKLSAEPGVASVEPKGTGLGVGQGSDQMVAEGAPATNYVAGKEGQTNIQNLRQQYEAQRTVPQEKFNYGPDLSSNKGIVSIGDDLNKVSKEELNASLPYYQELAKRNIGNSDRSDFRDAITMVRKIKNAINDVGKSPLGLTVATGVGIGLAMGAGSANAMAKRPIKDEDAIKTIIGEGESTGFQGMRALASAIRNRGTLQGAYGINSPRVINKLYSPKTYRLAKQAWQDSQKKDYSGGANHWFSDADLKKSNVQKMIKGMQKLASYRGNNFYKEGKTK